MRFSLRVLSIVLCMIVSVTIYGQTASTQTHDAVRAGGIEFVFASASRGRELLGKRDAFVDRMSPFDRTVRMRTSDDRGIDGFLEFASGEVIDWPDEDRRAVRRAVESLDVHLKQWKLPDVRRVDLIHTTGREESNAAYTRGNAIVLPRGKAGSLDNPPTRLLAHELFHVLSRSHDDWRNPYYAIIGFRATNEIQLPKSLAPMRITNPDAPEIRHIIRIEIEKDRHVHVAPVLFSNSDFDPNKRSIFDYLEFQLLEVIMIVGKQWIPVTRNGEPVLHQPNLPDFHRQIGGNTRYVIHPEEILADNFAALVTGASVKDQWVIDAMVKGLEGKPEAAGAQ